MPPIPRPAITAETLKPRLSNTKTKPKLQITKEIIVDIPLNCFCLCSSAPCFLTMAFKEYIITDERVRRTKNVKIITDAKSKYFSNFLSRFNDLTAR